MVTFNRTNWNIPQHILVQAEDDRVDLGTAYQFRLHHAVQSTDSKYDGTSLDVVLAVEDDDIAKHL